MARFALLLLVAVEREAIPHAWSLLSASIRSSRQRHHCHFLVGANKVFEDFVSADDDEEFLFGNDPPSDWLTAEFTLLQAPQKPNPSLDALVVATTVARSLQWVDYPTPNAGLERCFDFFSWECRKAVTARQGGDSLERFVEHGKRSPALQPFMGAHRIYLGEGTYTPPPTPPHRGAMVSFPIVLHSAPIYSLHHMSGMNRTGVTTPPERHMVMRLEEQRRPPMQGCWLVREVLDVRHFFAGDMGNAHVGG